MPESETRRVDSADIGLFIVLFPYSCARQVPLSVAEYASRRRSSGAAERARHRCSRRRRLHAPSTPILASLASRTTCMDLQTSPAGRTDGQTHKPPRRRYLSVRKQIASLHCSTMAVAATIARSDNDDDGRQEASGTLHTPPLLAAGTR